MNAVTSHQGKDLGNKLYKKERCPGIRSNHVSGAKPGNSYVKTCFV